VWIASPERALGRYMVSVLSSLGFRARVRALPGPDPYFNWVDDSRHRAGGFRCLGAGLSLPPPGS
jgi:hypothetical protein